MKIFKFLPVLLIFPVVSFGATRGDSNARVGMNRDTQAASRISTVVVHGMPGTLNDVNKNVGGLPVQNVYESNVSVAPVSNSTTNTATVTNTNVSETTTASSDKTADTSASSSDCRDAYRECMDNFCLLDESQGERCACSDNINRAKNKIKEVLAIQEEADKLFTEGVEREQLGAKARLVFVDKTNKSTGKKISFTAWLNGDDDEKGVGEDEEIGDSLYGMAADFCASELASCGKKAEMEEMLYTRMIVQDCKSYDAYLSDQKTNAESNKRIAESAVRKARLEMLDTTNKYNRGECLLAYRSCIADKGGCGANFENCLDASLLQRRSNACENILDQCMAVRDYVVQDWAEESKSVLEEAAKYADKNKRGTCLAKVQYCLEESCSTSTNAECLSDVNVAAGICPIITECDEMIPGFQAVVNDKLGYLQTKFCENDVINVYKINVV